MWGVNPSSLSTKIMTVPSVILVFSGKRKSGKDFITDLLQDRIGKDKCAIMRLSAPLKKQYAIDHGLDYERLLDASDYKERFRADMIKWGEVKRNADPGFFARIITSGPGSEKLVWMISDARRQTDVAYFLDNYPGKVMTVRVNADENIRLRRGWVFTPGVDDAVSECGLDTGVNFDVVITNNGSGDASLDASIGGLVQQVLSRLPKDF